MTLLLILAAIFIAVALMVVLGERYARPPTAEQMNAMRRWLMPLVGAALVLSLVNHYWL